MIFGVLLPAFFLVALDRAAPAKGSPSRGTAMPPRCRRPPRGPDYVSATGKKKRRPGIRPAFSVKGNKCLGFGDGNRARGANLYAALAAQALILIDGDRFAFLHLENAHRTNVDAFFIPGALVMVDFYPPGH